MNDAKSALQILYSTVVCYPPIPKPFSGLFCMSYIYLGDTDISESDSVWELKDQEGKQKKVTALIIQLKKENETK